MLNGLNRSDIKAIAEGKLSQISYLRNVDKDELLIALADIYINNVPDVADVYFHVEDVRSVISRLEDVLDEYEMSEDALRILENETDRLSEAINGIDDWLEEFE